MCDDVLIDIREGRHVNALLFVRCRLINIRHPLQELVDDRFVANDAYAMGQSSAESLSASHREGESEEVPRRGNSVVICTGANASGKSIYLKQCVLIPYMAQVGT